VHPSPALTALYLHLRAEGAVTDGALHASTHTHTRIQPAFHWWWGVKGAGWVMRRVLVGQCWLVK